MQKNQRANRKGKEREASEIKMTEDVKIKTQSNKETVKWLILFEINKPQADILIILFGYLLIFGAFFYGIHIAYVVLTSLSNAGYLIDTYAYMGFIDLLMFLIAIHTIIVCRRIS